ncbi:unnamed protein product [Leuciscus chuanchicus]
MTRYTSEEALQLVLDSDEEFTFSSEEEEDSDNERLYFEERLDPGVDISDDYKGDGDHQTPVAKRAKTNIQTSNKQSTLSWKTETDIDMVPQTLRFLPAREPGPQLSPADAQTSSDHVPVPGAELGSDAKNICTVGRKICVLCKGQLGGRRCLVLMTVCLGLICVLLLVFITLQHITITAERVLLKSYKNTVEEFNYTIISLQDKNTDLMTEKDQLKNNFNSLSQKKLELETRVNDLSAEKSQLQRSVDALNQKKLELETRVNDLSVEKSQREVLQRSFDALNKKKLELETKFNDLSAEKSQLQGSFDALNQKKLELETRVNDLSAEKSQLQRSVDALNQKKLELETRVNDLSVEKGQREVLQRSFDALNKKKLELETKFNDLSAEKSQLQGSFDALNQKKLELETRVTSWSEEPKKEKSKQGNLCSPGSLFMSDESKSWSESRQFCRDRGADLVIINTEEKQKHLTSFIKERVWIGLSDIENEGIMKWVDNSTLNQGFWFKDEPNNKGGDEDCVELIPSDSIQNWNDLPCSEKRKGTQEQIMELDDYYENPNRRNIMDTPGPQRHCQDEGRAGKCRGSRSLVLITVCLGILCLLLIAAVPLQHFQCSSKRGFLWGPDGLFMSSEPMSWSDSRHYCRDRGADLIIINTEEKQRGKGKGRRPSQGRDWLTLQDCVVVVSRRWSFIRSGYSLDPADCGKPRDKQRD